MPLNAPMVVGGELEVILGVDQTGAVDRKGQPKPLPCACLVRRDHNPWRLNSEALMLPSLSPSALESLVAKVARHTYGPGSMLLVVDAVLGLPKAFEHPSNSLADQIWNWFGRAANTPGWGRDTATIFFHEILAGMQGGSEEMPERRVEAALGANSVFRSRPFQRNIQTGTYRIWKDLGMAGPEAFDVWPFERETHKGRRPLICEGYPSLAWKTLNGSQRQKPLSKELMENIGQDVENLHTLTAMSPDHQDAAFLALFALSILHVRKGLPRPTTLTIEGDILGSDL